MLTGRCLSTNMHSLSDLHTLEFCNCLSTMAFLDRLYQALSGSSSDIDKFCSATYMGEMNEVDRCVALGLLKRVNDFLHEIQDVSIQKPTSSKARPEIRAFRIPMATEQRGWYRTLLPREKDLLYALLSRWDSMSFAERESHYCSRSWEGKTYEIYFPEEKPAVEVKTSLTLVLRLVCDTVAFGKQYQFEGGVTAKL